MRWPYKPKTVYDRIKRRFALIPRVVENEWVWLGLLMLSTVGITGLSFRKLK